MREDLTILAIDPGSKLGWALARGARLLESGTEDFTTRRGESPGARYLRFRSWLARIQATYGVGLVVHEQAHHRGGAATEVLAGFTTRCQEFAAEHGAELVPIHSQTLKKRTTGNGNAKKDAMIAAVQRRWRGVQIVDDNHADALALVALAIDDYCAAAA